MVVWGLLDRGDASTHHATMHYLWLALWSGRLTCYWAVMCYTLGCTRSELLCGLCGSCLPSVTECRQFQMVVVACICCPHRVAFIGDCWSGWRIMQTQRSVFDIEHNSNGPMALHQRVDTGPCDCSTSNLKKPALGCLRTRLNLDTC